MDVIDDNIDALLQNVNDLVDDELKGQHQRKLKTNEEAIADIDMLLGELVTMEHANERESMLLSVIFVFGSFWSFGFVVFRLYVVLYLYCSCLFVL